MSRVVEDFGVGDLVLRAVLEGKAASLFTRKRAQELHADEAGEVHSILKNFFYGGCECPWCGSVLCPSGV